jgi:hypothetical protein
VLILTLACHTDTPQTSRPAGETASVSDSDDTDTDTTDTDTTDTDDTDTEPVGPFGENLLLDGDFEDEDFGAWTLADDVTCSRLSALEDGTLPASGAQFLYGGTRSLEDCRVHQTVDLAAAGFSLSAIDAGGIAIEGEVWLGSLMGDGAMDDHIWLTVSFLDGDGATISRLATRASTTPTWQLRTLDGLVPPDTRALYVELQGIWRLGSSNETHADAARIWLTPASPVDPGILKQPMLQDYRPDAMTILWETDSNRAVHAVNYGVSGEALSQTAADILTRRISDGHYLHIAELTDLTGQTAYDYTVSSGATTSTPHTFTTAPDSTTPVRITWLGDNHQASDTFSTHVAHMSARDPDLFIAVGDLVNYGEGLEEPGELVEWNDYWFAPLETEDFSARVPVLFARGNHEKHHEMGYAYSALPGNGAWYAFDYGAAHIIVLDSQAGLAEAQRVFVEEALFSAEAQAAKWLIVTFHMAPYSNATKVGSNGDGIAELRENWVPQFEEAGVDLVVNAHFHSYQRGDQEGVVYTIVGGGGGSMDTQLEAVWSLFDVYQHTFHYAVMDLSGDTLSWSVYDLDDALIDSFTLTK